eukprot:CAMPEP_0172311522 /NCGR_PEP_ID=MMETSP1058-20130122/14992_1 /TAXON_ID=83371 /ORGANISM="Detonula confervacea, Strain CCMP 353" /LENGTH=34 /DNA_ID= /DNA_START= /DNA_END= /DNA_ORIENTATION=
MMGGSGDLDACIERSGDCGHGRGLNSAPMRRRRH